MFYLEPGSYNVRLIVTNTTRISGALAGATLGIGISARTPEDSLIPPQIAQVSFGAGESRNLYYNMIIPEEIIGQIGEITAWVEDPNGFVLASRVEEFSVEIQPISLIYSQLEAFTSTLNEPPGHGVRVTGYVRNPNSVSVSCYIKCAFRMANRYTMQGTHTGVRTWGLDTATVEVARMTERPYTLGPGQEVLLHSPFTWKDYDGTWHINNPRLEVGYAYPGGPVVQEWVLDDGTRWNDFDYVPLFYFEDNRGNKSGEVASR